MAILLGLSLVVLLIYPVGYVPCRMLCRSKLPSPSCDAPGCGGVYKSCVQKCMGTTDFIIYPYCFEKDTKTYCVNNKTEIALLKLQVLLGR